TLRASLVVPVAIVNGSSMGMFNGSMVMERMVVPDIACPFALTACAIALFILVSLYGQFDQTVQQLWIGEAARLPQLGIHTYLCKARESVDLVDVDASS